MADGDVKYRFFADAAAAERAIAGLEKKYESLENKIKETARASKRAKDDDASATANAMGALQSLVGQYATAAGAVQVLQQAYAHWRQEIEAAADAEDKFGKNLLRNLTLSGDLARGPQIQQMLQNMPGVTQEAAASTFFGVRGGAPSLDLARAQEVTQQVAGTQGFIFRDNLEQLSAFGELAGKLAELAPDKSAQDITDLTSAVSAAAGRNVGALTSQGTIKGIGQLMEGGKPIEEALALAVRGLDVGMRAQSLGNLKPEDMKMLGEAQVAALKDSFGQSQVNDLSLQNMRAAAQLQPDDFLGFGAEAKLQGNVRGLGQRAEARGARQQMEIADADNAFTRMGAQFGAWVENLLTPLVELRREREGSTADRAIPQVEEASGRKLDEMVTLLKQIADQGQQNRPPLRRDAQTE